MTTLPTPAELDRLRELEKAATKGPWEWTDSTPPDEDERYPHVPQGSYIGTTLITLGDTYEESREDCALLAALRNAAPSLLLAASTAITLEAQMAKVREFFEQRSDLLFQLLNDEIDRYEGGRFVEGEKHARDALSALLAALAKETKDG